MPNTRDMNISFALSAVDATDGKGKYKPVLSLIRLCTERNNNCYYISGDFGRVGVGAFLTDWVQLGAIVPELIYPPCSGNREIHIAVRMFNSSDPPTIVAGRASDDGELILSEILSFTHQFTEKGYEEASKDIEESQAISLKIGMAVAMADGSLEDVEGELFKNWIINEISVFSDNEQKRLKSIFNKALKEGFSEAKNRTLSLSELVDRLSEIGDKKSKYDAVRLCLDVMAADGVADPKEMSVIRNVAKRLDLDMDEIEGMREEKIRDLVGLTSEEGMEGLLGIEFSWSDEQKRKHLRKEFQKWSNRITSFPEGEEREAAQKMLDMIARLRKKYG